MKKFIKITLSLVLAVILLVTAMPIYAVEDTSIKEVEELREENVKHFEMPDGTFKAIVYSEPVHRKDADGKWQDIDNTLSSEKENGNTNYSSFDGRIKFSKNVKNANGKILELSENGYKISFSLIDENIKSTSADVKNHKGKKTPTVFDSEKEKLDKLQSVDNLTKISYNNIKKGIDIEYEIYANNIKESIIVNSKQSDYVYKFELKLNKLLAILNEDGSISLIDEESGEEKYTMPAPFMFDDNGELSTDVYYTLTQNGKYKYELTVTADEEWINDSGRNFPVTIDPTVSYTSYYGEAYVSAANPNTNYGFPSELWVGSNYISYLKFNIPTLAASSSITEATLDIKYYYNISSGYMNVGIYPVSYSWDDETITWNNSVGAHSGEASIAPLYTEYLAASSSITASSPALIHFDMTSIVQDWYAGKPNNGIALKRTSGSNQSVIIKSYNSGSSNRSKLYITYERLDNILSGTFFLKNVEYNKYIQSNSSNIKLLDFDGNTYQKWEISYLRNGYYKITSLENGKVITAPSSAGSPLTETSYSVSYNQMWRITQDSNGLYVLSPKSNPSYYMTAEGGTVLFGNRDVELGSSQSDNKDEWILYTQSDYILMYMGDYLGDPAMPPIISAVEYALQTSANMNGYGYSSLTKEEFLVLFSTTSIFSCITHGLKNSIAVSDGTVTINDIENLAPVNNLEFVYLGACLTGEDEASGNNLVNAIYNKGADAVLGFTTNVFVSETNIWTKLFMTRLASGDTISEAIRIADEELRTNYSLAALNILFYSTGSRYIAGSNQIAPCS